MAESRKNTDGTYVLVYEISNISDVRLIYLVDTKGEIKGAYQMSMLTL